MTDICAEIETPVQLYVGDLVETSRNALITGIGEITGIASDDYPGTTEHFIVNFGDCIGTCTVHAGDMKKYVSRKQREVSICNPKADVAPNTNPEYWDCYCDDKYIQSKSVEECEKCGAWSGEMPDSRQGEIDLGMFFADACPHPETQQIGHWNVCTDCGRITCLHHAESTPVSRFIPVVLSKGMEL